LAAAEVEADVLILIRRARLWRYPAAAGIVLMAGLTAYLLHAVVGAAALSMVFLAGVVVTAVTLGAAPAYFAAILTFLVYNYYLMEPRFTFRLASTEDFLSFGFFLGVAILTGGLAGRLRDQSRRNVLRARATAALFDASRRLSSVTDEDAMRQDLVAHIAMAAKGPAALTDGQRVWLHPATAESPPFAGGAGGAAPLADLGGWRIRPIDADGTALGLAAWRVDADEREDPERDRLISVLIDLGATAIARARLANVQADLQAAAKTEQLRTALLSSISHDLRTPLAAILASASSLRAFGAQFPPDVRDDLVSTIEEEAERLNQFVANLLSMTKLESGALALERQVFDAAEVVNRAADRLEKTRRREVQRIGAEALVAEGDPILLEQALGNVLENAARYSAADCPISIRCSRLDEGVRIEVEDFGPGVPDRDLERIFDKFYRSPPSSAGVSQGTGLGLSIAKGMLEAMNGSIRAENRKGGLGLRVLLALPSPHHA
jgi:two-component system sensor histidine kinase KdpD